MTPQTYLDFHTQSVMNTISFLIDNQEPFKVIVDDQHRKYAEVFPTDAYQANGTVHLTFIEWSLEESGYDIDQPLFYATVVFGESNVVKVTIDAVDIAAIFVLKSPNFPLYHLFFPITQEPITADQPIISTIEQRAAEWAEHNAEAIALSTSKLTLLTLGE